MKREIKELRADVAGLGKKVGFLEKLVSDMHWFNLDQCRLGLESNFPDSTRLVRRVRPAQRYLC